MSELSKIILNDPIIEDIKNNPERLWSILQKEPPEEWLMTGVSEVDGSSYKYFPISTSEFLMDTIFSFWNDKVTFQEVSFPSPSSAVVTTTIDIEFLEKNIFIPRHKSGTASIIVIDNFYYDKSGKIKFREAGVKKPMKAYQLLRTATPLCFTEAKKNAIKNICPLFGRNINRDILEYVPRETSEENVKMKPDIVIIRKYENAIKAGDEKAIEDILNNYEIDA